MDANKRQYQYSNTGTSYTYGNTARKLNVVPDVRREELEVNVPQHRRQERTAPKAMSGMNFASLLVLTIAIIATVSVCVDYLKLQTEVSKMEKSIITLDQQLTTLTNVNDASYASIDTAPDLNEVYKIAVEELGMVYPNDNTVIAYESSDDDYVRQYEDIPED